MSRSRHRRPPRPHAPAPEARAPITVRVDRLASSGDAVGTDAQGKTVFVEGAVPGDLVRVRIEREKARWARGRVEEILEPSASRVDPRCPHFPVCGGCTWQHVSYEAQVSAKARILRDALERIGGFALPEPPPITPSPEAHGYRGRARIRIQGGRPGYLARGSHRHQPVSECSVLAPELEAIVRGWAAASSTGADRDGSSASSSGADRADVERAWSICVGRDGAVSMAASGTGDEPGSMAPLEADDESGRDARPALSLGDEPRRVVIATAGEGVTIDALAFSQANRLLHETLARRVIEVLLEGVADATVAAWRILEVHAGVGFFTLPLARRVASVVAVEADPHAVSLLRENVAAAAEGHAPVDVVEGFFGRVDVAALASAFDAVLVDPPRSGLEAEEIRRIVELAPARIVYLSCDPATLARDARVFGEAGWQLTHVEGFDLFPQTPHTEGLLRMERPHV